MTYEHKSSEPYHRENEVWKAKYETAESLCQRYFEGTFRLKGGTVIWEAISHPANAYNCFISRVVKSGGKPFFMGLGYQSRYIKPSTLIEVITHNS